MEVVYFKTDTSGPVILAVEERIDFSELGREFELDPNSIELNETGIPRTGLQSAITWQLLEETFKQAGRPVGAEDDPVMVTGEAAIHAVSTGLSSGVPDKLLQDLTEYLAE